MEEKDIEVWAVKTRERYRQYRQPQPIVRALVLLLQLWLAVLVNAQPQANHGKQIVRLRSDRTTAVRLPPSFDATLRQGKTVTIDTSPATLFPISVSWNLETSQAILAVPSTVPAGEYALTLRITGAPHEEMVIQVDSPPRLAVGSRTPVILMNGWQSGLTCPVSTTSPPSAGTFRNLEQHLSLDGAPVLFFDNCRECPDCSIERLGDALKEYLSGLSYTDGRTVDTVDLVAHSMGGLIARSYLAGKRFGSATFFPPENHKVRKLVTIATPHFGAFKAVSLGVQSGAMVVGSQMLWDLATWNQRIDDLRGVDAIAVIGNSSPYGAWPNASDGLVSLASASLAFAVEPERTRIVPYCHSAPNVIVDCQNAPPIAAVDSEKHLTGRIVRAFLAGSDGWKIGTTPPQDPFLSRFGGIYLRLHDTADRPYNDLMSVSFGPNQLTRPTGNAQIFNREWLPASEDSLTFTWRDASPLRYRLKVQPGAVKALKVKTGGPYVYGVTPAAGSVKTLEVAGGSLVSIFGVDLASGTAQANSLPLPTRLSDVSVFVDGRPIGLSYAGEDQINAYLPQGITGLVTLTVSNSSGKDSVSVKIAPAVPAVFSTNGGGTGPAAAVHATTNELVTAVNPARKGEIITLYLTGLGQTVRIADLDVVTVNPLIGIYPATQAKLLFAGLAPGYVGLYQINFEVPAESQSGSAVPLIVLSGKRYSNLTTIAVQ